VRGIWRRTTREEYRKEAPAWETVLDLDALGAAEGESWVWGGYSLLDEGPGKPRDLALVKLSRGGADAQVVREFSLADKAFIPPDQGGFFVPEAKSDVKYKSRDVIFVGTDFGPGSLTDSGYPRTAREWTRGTPLEQAPMVYEGQQQDVAAFVARSHERRGYVYDWQGRSITFYTSEYFLRVAERPDGPGSSEFTKLEVPEDASVGTFADQLLLFLRSEYKVSSGTFPAGSLLATPLEPFLVEPSGAAWTPLFVPSETVSLDDYSCTKNLVVLQLLDKVKSRLEAWRYSEDGSWLPASGSAQGAVADIAAVGVSAVASRESDEAWLVRSSFLEPSALYLRDLGAAEALEEPFAGGAERLKSLPHFFQSEGLEARQFEATSADGTKVPYFQVGRPGASGPTLLYGYGGFEVSLTPSYAATVGAAWLEAGGTFVEANIRGGGEFGPAWHQAALKEKRHRAYEDFEAVAKDLVGRGVTTADRLGIMGGSNGGLLVGNMLARSPELFGAVVCQVPLLDMSKYHKLLAGASWMAEYGDPDDPKQWEFIRGFSPYHTLKPGARYPPALFTTSTRDDRVHPGHARKMVRRLLEEVPGADEVYYYENIEGGHGGAADNRQRAFMKTLEYTFLWDALSRAGEQAPAKS